MGRFPVVRLSLALSSPGLTGRSTPQFAAALYTKLGFRNTTVTIGCALGTLTYPERLINVYF